MAVKIAFHTLGCKLNFAETAQIAHTAKEAGFETTMDIDASPADVYVINTCSVTDNADKECEYLVRKVKKNAPDSVVVVTGCYAQLQGDKLKSIKGVDMLFGVSEKFNIVTHLQQYLATKEKPKWGCHISEVEGFNAALSFESRTRGFLKVQDGCNYSCSFCTIPTARGKSRSDTIEGVLKNIDTLRAMGIKEIVLTGINLGDFRSPEGENFYQLLSAIEVHFTDDVRFRISSIEPNLLSDEIIALVARSQKIVPHFHIPLQSGSNKILALMRRRYKRELYQDRVQLIKSLMPHCAIGVDVICGFPSETEEDFRETFTFLEQLPISYLHVFTYSERSGTKALEIEHPVPTATRQKYNHQLRLLSLQKQQDFFNSQRGKKRKVLFESQQTAKGEMHGYTENYVKIKTPFDATLVNQYVDWVVE